MNLTQQIAKQFKEVYFGGNWTGVNFKDTLEGVTWQQATTKMYSFNTIAALVFHINYYVTAILAVLKKEQLTAHDKYSFDHPPIQSEEDWSKLLNKTWTNANDLVALVEQLPDSRLEETFVVEKYGNYYRNLHGVTQHTHYHLGQIVLLKKMLKDNNLTQQD
jgi:hypothetical protein